MVFGAPEPPPPSDAPEGGEGGGGRFFAGMDTLYPYAWEALLRYWKEHLANPILMSRCMRQSTTNINESLHQKAS